MKNFFVLLMVISLGCSIVLAEVNESVIQSISLKNMTGTNVTINKNAESKKGGATSDPGTILQGGDTIYNLTMIESIPYEDSGTTVGYTDNYDEVCPFTSSNSPDVVYAYTAEQDIYVNINLYGSSYDTKLFVYENAVTEGDPFACNDDYYTDGTSALINLELFAGNTYCIIIDGFAGAEGDYVITVTAGDAPMDICPTGSLFTQAPNYPDDISWDALISDVYGDGGDLTAVYENYSFNSGAINGITFCGFTLIPQEEGYYDVCTDDQPLFDVVFYSNDDDYPDNEIASFIGVEATISETGYTYSGLDLYQYTIDFSSSVDLPEGWITIRGNGDPENCIFYWVTSNSQSHLSYVYYESELYQYGRDFAFCLLGEEVSGTGETCDDPIIVDTIPFADEGNACDFDDDCDIDDNDAEDIIYKMTVDEGEYYSVSLANSDYDTRLAIYFDECCGDNYWAYNDDYGGELTSQIDEYFEPGIYYIVIDGFEGGCGNYELNIQLYTPPDPGCAHSYPDPNGSFAFMDSDTEYGPFKIYDNFSCDDGSAISAVTFWGANLYRDSEGYYECDESGTQMGIIFYPDNNGAPDVDNPTCSYTVTPEVTGTGLMYLSYPDTFELKEYEALLSEPCGITSGWISIQGVSDNGDTCIFTWINSEDGDAMGYREYDGELTEISYDFAMEFEYTTGIEDESEESLPTSVDILACYPNPFNPTTTISFTLANSGNVAIDIYDILGRRIDKLDLGYLTSGQTHSVNYDASNMATGVYFYSLNVDGQTKVTERFSLLK